MRKFTPMLRDTAGVENGNDITPRLREIFRNNYSQLSDIRSDLISTIQKQDVTSLYVTSARRGEGKTTMSVGIAYGLKMVATGQVALVEASIYSQSFDRVFDVSMPKAGFYDYLLGHAELDEITLAMEKNDPIVIPVGTEKARNAWLETYEDGRYTERLKKLTDNFMYAVFDGDSLLAAPGSAIGVQDFDAAILTIECGSTKWQVASLARDKLAGYGANILGIAMNRRRYPIPKAIYSRV